MERTIAETISVMNNKGDFRPDQPLTRAGTGTNVNRMIGKALSKYTSQVTWKDVPSTYWAYDQIEAASH